MFIQINSSYLSARPPKNPSSKSTKRLIESEKLVETRRVATKKYQHTVKQRSKALQKNTLDKAGN